MTTAITADTRVSARPSPSQWWLLLADFVDSLRGWRLWLYLGWNDIAKQYRRSFLGPIWISINTGLFIVAFGFVGAQLFNMDLRAYLPYFCIGHVAFGFLSASISESCQTFMAAEAFLKQIRCPKLSFVFRILVRNLILFFHNLLIVAAVLLWSGDFAGIRWIELGLGVILVLPALWLLAAIVAAICARFRDVPMIVQSLLQLSFFVTPVIWHLDRLQGKTREIVELNPLTVFLELIRAPLLGQPLAFDYVCSALAWIGLLGIAFVVLYRVARRRIVYWI